MNLVLRLISFYFCLLVKKKPPKKGGFLTKFKLKKTIEDIQGFAHIHLEFCQFDPEGSVSLRDVILY